MVDNNGSDFSAVKKLTVAIDDALSLLRESSYCHTPSAESVESPSSLLDQCLSLCAQQEASKPEPIRTIHHFACTGGTLFSKCIAAMPNTQILSEVDPLSTYLDVPGQSRFSPTDMVTLMRQSTRGVSQDLIIKLFLNNLEMIYSNSGKQGLRLILRDHAHSHFCLGSEVPDRPTCQSIVSENFDTLSVVTVRDPVDSFLSLKSNGWVTHTPATFDEYCKRYIEFLKAHDEMPIFRYEDFVREPENEMSKLCGILNIPFSEQFTNLFSVIKLTGDSGRSGSIIEPKPRRVIDRELSEDMENSTNYLVLRKILKY